MRIAAFCYDFEHQKSQDGLVHLSGAGFDIGCVLAAPWSKLRVAHSSIRISPARVPFVHPASIAKALNVPYYSVRHNTDAAVEIIRKHQCDLGVILGARILKPKIIDACRLGILNMHPGHIPSNRGLDNIKWAILNGMPQEVTAHLISEEIDLGIVVGRRHVPVLYDDTFLDIHLRSQGIGHQLMVDVIHQIDDGSATFERVTDSGQYFSAVPPELEASLETRFHEYRLEFGSAST